MAVSAWIRPRSWKVGFISAGDSSSSVLSADGHGAGSAGGGDCGGGSAPGGPPTAPPLPPPTAAARRAGVPHTRKPAAAAVPGQGPCPPFFRIAAITLRATESVQHAVWRLAQVIAATAAAVKRGDGPQMPRFTHERSLRRSGL